MIPIVVTLVGIVMLVIGHCAYCKLVIIVVPAGIVTDVKTVNVYRFIPVTVYVLSNNNNDDDNDADNDDDSYFD